MNIDSLPVDSLIIPAPLADALLSEDQAEGTRIDATTSHNATFDSAYVEKHEPNPNIANAFIVGLSYTSARGDGADLDPSQLENIPVGIQEHAIAPASIQIVAATNNPEAVKIPTKIADLRKQLKDAIRELHGKAALEDDIEILADSIQKQMPMKMKAIAQQKRNVSRRLLMAERAKRITVTCDKTGIVSQMEIPAIPGMALTWLSPFAEVDNCRGMAQKGADYLIRLDTQTLAGILIALAGVYDLFVFQPYDSGAQKNAIVRTAGKDFIIKAILLIENQIHSGNAKYLPKLSLIFDSVLEAFGAEIKMQAYLKLLADAIAKPDKEEYDPSYINKDYKIRPVYVRDVKKQQQTVSFLAKKEIAAAKKQYAEDRKAGKIAITQLIENEEVSDLLKGTLASLMAEDALLIVPMEKIEKIVARLERYESAAAKTIIAILMRDRRHLMMDVSEIEDEIKETLETTDETDEEEQDDPTPGNEAAILEDHTGIDAETMGNDLPEMDSEDDEAEGSTLTELPETNELTDEEIMAGKYVFSGDPRQIQPVIEKTVIEKKQEELVAPEGLDFLGKLLWKKKIEAAQKAAKPRVFIQSDIPSVAVYVPTKAHAPETTGPVSYTYSQNRLYVIGNLANNKRIYFTVDDYGILQPVRFFSHWED